jgi:hypothetical protein
MPALLDGKVVTILSPGDFLDKLNAGTNIRFSGGHMQIQNETTGLWHDILCDNNIDGNAELQLEQVGVV